MYFVVFVVFPIEQELRKMEHLQAGSSMSPMISRRVSNVQGDPNHDELLSQLKTENQTLQLKCERLQKKEKRIMVDVGR